MDGLIQYFTEKKMPRSICIFCKKKRERAKMVKHGQHWTCRTCVDDLVPGHSSGGMIDRSCGDPGHRIKVLNLYAGIGGNRHLWPGNLAVTAVERNVKVAAEYKRNFPLDHVVVGDAHSYLLRHYLEFNIIWSSPPCQSHSKLMYPIKSKQFPDLILYQEILFLRHFFDGLFVVENVRPYYEPLVPAQFNICRHLFWTNVPELNEVELPDFPEEFKGRYKGICKMDRDDLCSWLGITAGNEKIYLSAKSSSQVYRNCVHPLLGQSIMNDILNAMTGDRQAAG